MSPIQVSPSSDDMSHPDNDTTTVTMIATAATAATMSEEESEYLRQLLEECPIYEEGDMETVMKVTRKNISS